MLQEIDQDHPEFPIYRGYYEHQHGWLELMAGQWDEAWNSFQRAEDTHRELRDFGALAQTMYWQAEWQDLRGQTTDALNRIEGGVGYAADHEAPAIQARLMAAQARLLRKQGKMEESQQALVASHKLAKSTGVERVLAYIQLEIARWSSQAKSIEQGLVMGRKALEVFERLPDREGGAAIYAALGRLYLRQGNTKHAGKYFGFAQNYYAELGAEWQGAFLAPDRAAWAAQVDKSEQRQAFLEEGLALADKFDLAEARGLILVEQSKTLEDAQQVKESLSEAFQLLRDGGNMLAAGRARRLLKQKQTGRAPASS